jgi:hypothetical protein
MNEIIFENNNMPELVHLIGQCQKDFNHNKNMHEHMSSLAEEARLGSLLLRANHPIACAFITPFPIWGQCLKGEFPGIKCELIVFGANVDVKVEVARRVLQRHQQQTCWFEREDKLAEFTTQLLKSDPQLRIRRAPDGAVSADGYWGVGYFLV